MSPEEVTFKELRKGTGTRKDGYRKIKFCEARAIGHGLEYSWVDTCCIDKSSSAELSEAINSMFRWYRDAAKCYVYLSDVNALRGEVTDQLSWEPAFRKSRWFKRGWTLQELLAPRSVEFYSVEGTRLGDKESLQSQIHEITGIPIRVLQGYPLSIYTVDERILWAKHREVLREEDAAYSLLGLFDIHMPLIYGEGRQKALHRLHKGIHEMQGKVEYGFIEGKLSRMTNERPRAS
ncbi:HET-domain-containing protein [Eremomyces bilateralis CBS 781.70]|uniref:HET-domain-containing protein n=1 Tax=Eremomyces bilateralis CBS 781.70 TaxID=1392243 RepID=A0A6G1FZY8_9PEZI|nr:HET-domain-containing protein [Eremomyces bilateralis CBS 781.70]KAF1811427.1 HET-domain-containing protein [Eremomyces bilateralis CBS 781.70]